MLHVYCSSAVIIPLTFIHCADLYSKGSSHDSTSTTNNTTSQSDGPKCTSRSTCDCLQWAVGGGIAEHLKLTDLSGEACPGKLYCSLCATWLMSKGAVSKGHVLGKNKKNMDGGFARKPGTYKPGTYACERSA